MNDSNGCIEITSRGKICEKRIFKKDLCIRHHNFREKNGLKTHKGVTKRCTNGHHKRSGSKYPAGKVPIENFQNLNDPNKIYATCIDCRVNKKNAVKIENEIGDEGIDEEESDDEKERCSEITNKNKRCTRKAAIGTLCKYHHNFKLKKDGIFNIEYDPNKDEGPTKVCGCPSHASYGSKYPKDKVPQIYFQKREGDFDDLLVSCIDCRNYATNMGRKRKKNISEIKEVMDEGDSKVCRSLFHDIKGVSPFPRNAVPIDLFSHKSKDAKHQSNSCTDCRKYKAGRKKKYKNKSTEEAKNQGKFYCYGCDHKLDLEQQSINKDKTHRIYCIDCKEK